MWHTLFRCLHSKETPKTSSMLLITGLKCQIHVGSSSWEAFNGMVCLICRYRSCSYIRIVGDLSMFTSCRVQYWSYRSQNRPSAQTLALLARRAPGQQLPPFDPAGLCCLINTDLQTSAGPAGNAAQNLQPQQCLLCPKIHRLG